MLRLLPSLLVEHIDSSASGVLEQPLIVMPWYRPLLARYDWPHADSSAPFTVEAVITVLKDPGPSHYFMSHFLSLPTSCQRVALSCRMALRPM